MSIQFFDCPNCSKSLRVGARACHHCHAIDENDWADPDAAAEFASGGYGVDDDDASGSFASPTLWRRIVVLVALLLLLAFLLELILPMVGSQRRAAIVR